MTDLLKGVRLLSIQHCGAGPYGSQRLANVGALVIPRQLVGRNSV